MENKEFYFTTGELARLTGLSKQLLIFYDKKNFFTATATGSNGYRYYLLSKYFQLKILITLRKMDIPFEPDIYHRARERTSILSLGYRHVCTSKGSRLTYGCGSPSLSARRELLSRQHSRLHFTIVVPARETARHNLLLLDTLHPAHTWYKRASRIHHEAGHLSQSPWIWSLWCH